MKVNKEIESAAAKAADRLELWSMVVNALKVSTFAEVGVFQGDFAQSILRQCPTVEKYYMIDPWRHLDDWNKPANRPNDEFAAIKAEALAKTEFASPKRVILQGRTTEIACSLPEQGLDFAYIDGDHTLRGITIDLIRIWPKLRNGGILAGDDFCNSVWQHEATFEPTLVFPLAVYFAEAMGATIYGLPYDQFAIIVDRSTTAAFEFRDLTGAYRSTTLRDALTRSRDGLFGRALRRFKHLVPSRRGRS
jgi:hypothetical protein